VSAYLGDLSISLRSLIPGTSAYPQMYLQHIIMEPLSMDCRVHTCLHPMLHDALSKISPQDKTALHDEIVAGNTNGIVRS
jgi:hypothetical protein